MQALFEKKDYKIRVFYNIQDFMKNIVKLVAVFK